MSQRKQVKDYGVKREKLDRVNGSPDEPAKDATEKEMLERPSRRLSQPGTTGSAVTDQDDFVSKVMELEAMETGYAALLWLAQHCEMPPVQALEAIRAKATRTTAESEALAAWDRVKDTQILKDWRQPRVWKSHLCGEG